MQGDRDLSRLEFGAVAQPLTTLTNSGGAVLTLRRSGTDASAGALRLLTCDSHGDVNTNLWQFAAVENEAGVAAYRLDYGTGEDSAITLTVKGEMGGMLILVR